MVAPTFYPAHSGAGLRFYRYLPFFIQNHIDVSVITGTPKLGKSAPQEIENRRVNLEDGKLISITQIFEAKIYKYKLPCSGTNKRAKILLSEVVTLCKDKERSPDVVHIIAPMPFRAIFDLRQLRKTGVKLIYSYTIAMEKKSSIFANLLQRWKARVVLNQYDYILVQSNTLKKNILNIIPNANVKIIPNGVDTTEFSPAENLNEKILLRKKHNLNPNAKYISFIGAIHPRKGVDLLIDAWTKLISQYNDIHLLIIGPRIDQASKEMASFYLKIDDTVAESKFGKNIHFFGHIKEVGEYLKLSDIFVFPSRREGMPNAVLEAMSTGLPVILSPFMGFSSELGKDKKEFICVEHSSDAIANSIASLLNSEEERLTLARRARIWVCQNMELSTSANSHCDLYQTIVNN